MARSTSLSSVDTAWWRMEDPTNLMMITGILTFARPVSFPRLAHVIEQRLLTFDRFRQRVVESRLGGLAWEDDPHFDLRYHLRHIALPAPGDQATLQALVSDFMSTPLDYKRPLWQFHLIDNYEGGAVLLGRLHHCIGDGIALIQVLLSMTDSTPDGDTRPEPPTASAHPKKQRGPLQSLMAPLKLSQRIWNEGQELLGNPTKMMELARMGASGATTLGKMTFRWPDPQTVFKGELGVQKKAAWSQALNLNDVKAVGKVTGGTVNDVLLTAMTGALRRYLQHRGQAVEGVNIRAAVPVNLRRPDAPLELGNKFGLVFLSLPVGLADPVERLTELKRRMDELKDSPEAVVVLGLLNAVGSGPVEIQNLLVTLFGTKATAVMTNVPGPRQPIYLAGEEMNGIMFWVPQSGRLGLGVSIISYSGRVWLGVATDAGLMPDPDNIIEAFHTEFDGLMELVTTVKEEAPTAPLPQCQATTKAGQPCRNHPLPGSPFCRVHQGSEPAQV